MDLFFRYYLKRRKLGVGPRVKGGVSPCHVSKAELLLKNRRIVSVGPCDSKCTLPRKHPLQQKRSFRAIGFDLDHFGGKVAICALFFFPHFRNFIERKHWRSVIVTTKRTIKRIHVKMQQTRHERCRSTVGWLSFSFFLLVSSVSVSLANASTDTWHSHSRISNSTGARFLSEDGQEMVHIVVGLKNDEQVTFKRRTFKNEFKATKAVTMTVPVAEVPEIEQLPQVKYVQEDAKSYAMGSLRSVNRQKHSAMTTESYVIYSNQTISSRVLSTDNSGETLPWGIQVIQGHLDHVIPNPPSGTSFPICIVDSGLLLNHVDVPFSKGDSNIKGEYFGVDPSMPWHSPKDAHGTHVGVSVGLFFYHRHPFY